MMTRFWSSLFALTLFNLGCALAPQVSSESDPSLLWGPYRPNVYFGIRPRIPESLLMGLMWTQEDGSGLKDQYLRHSCHQNDGVAGFGWQAYDARTGGTQTIRDIANFVDITTAFVKPSSHEACCQWGLRISGTPRADAPKDLEWLLVFYIGSEARNPDEDTFLVCEAHNESQSAGCYGHQNQIDNFTLHIQDMVQSNHQRQSNSPVVRSDTVPPDGIWQAQTLYTSHVRSGAKQGDDGTMYFVEKRFAASFQVDIVFSSNQTQEPVTSDELTKGLESSKSAFSNRFGQTFSPKMPFGSALHLEFLEATLSNLLAGIGYFHGDSMTDLSKAPEYEENDLDFWLKVADARKNAEPRILGPDELFSTVPSRAFFPRGFLWDEGFDLLVILEWDLDLAVEIVQSWLNLMDDNGWIAREQILGSESRSRVPPEFRVQYPQHANPPTLFMVVTAFVRIHSGSQTYKGHSSRYLDQPQMGLDLLKSLYPLLNRHYMWFRSTQAGDVLADGLVNSSSYEGYRWRGRTPNYTLPSGLDDYPRAEPPQPGELHVDALSWVGLMAKGLKQISQYLGEDQDASLYDRQAGNVQQSLEALYWCEYNQAYCDVSGNGTLVCHKGYMSLFPFMLGLMNPTHPHLKAILDLIQDENGLWSPFGIRSLSKRDEYYGIAENYWRGAIWVNLNFLILEQLLILAQGRSPHRAQARTMYLSLRENLVTTVYDSWRSTGYVWEHYNAESGIGQGAFQFTGWTALVVKIAAMPDFRGRGVFAMFSSAGGWTWDSYLMAFTALLIIFIFFFRRKTAKLWTSLLNK